MAYAPQGNKQELKRAKRQVANVIDLRKCMGCQTCTVACKNLWTKRPGTEHMRWMNVSTYPGKLYPRDVEKKGGGRRDGVPQKGELTTFVDCGDNFSFNHDEVYNQGKGQTVHFKPMNSKGEDPEWGYNWDEDEGGGSGLNPYFFYFPKKCNHCSNPACVDACTHNALYKREEDGIVVLDQERCRGDRHCIQACPYKAIYYNPLTEKSEKCVFCFPRVEVGIAPACDRQCPGRTRHFGYLDDENSDVYKLVKKWKVALPLHPEYGTEPNVYYIPPWSPRAYAEDGSITDEMRIPTELLEGLFGPEVKRVLATLDAERQKKMNKQESELMDILISRDWHSMFGGFTEDPLIQARMGGKSKG